MARGTPLLAVVLVAAGCTSSRATETSEASDVPRESSVAQTSPAAGAEPLTLDYKSERKRLAQRGLAYDTGRVTIDPLEAPKVVAGPDPAQAEEELAKGLDLIRRNRVLDGLQAHTKAVLLAPEDPRMYVALGDAMMHKPYTDKAEAAYRTAQDLGLDTAELHWKLAESLLHQNERAAAIEELRATLARDPEHAPALERLAINLFFVGDLAGSDDAIARAEALGHALPPQFLALRSQADQEGR